MKVACEDKDAFLKAYNSTKISILENKNNVKEEKKQLALNNPKA